MKILIVCYSRTGNNKFIVNKINEKLNADVEWIQSEKEYNWWLWIFKLAMSSMFTRILAIKEPEKNIDDYDLVILSCPIWLDRIPWQMRTYINNYCGWKKKKFAFIGIAWWVKWKSTLDFELDSLLWRKLEASLQLYISDLLPKRKKIGIKDIIKVKVDSTNISKLDDQINEFVDKIEKLN